MTYSEHELEFTFANNEHRSHCELHVDKPGITVPPSRRDVRPNCMQSRKFAQINDKYRKMGPVEHGKQQKAANIISQCADKNYDYKHTS